MWCGTATCSHELAHQSGSSSTSACQTHERQGEHEWQPLLRHSLLVLLPVYICLIMILRSVARKRAWERAHCAHPPRCRAAELSLCAWIPMCVCVCSVHYKQALPSFPNCEVWGGLLRSAGLSCVAVGLHAIKGRLRARELDEVGTGFFPGRR